MSSYMESYESIEIHDENAREFVIDLIIRSDMNVL